MEKIDGQILKDLRKQHGYSLRAFADKIYASKSAVQRWEQSYIPEDALEKICEVFNITIDDLQSKHQPKHDENNLTPEQLTELKFGIKRLSIVLAALTVISLTLLIILVI